MEAAIGDLLALQVIIGEEEPHEQAPNYFNPTLKNKRYSNNNSRQAGVSTAPSSTSNGMLGTSTVNSGGSFNSRDPIYQQLANLQAQAQLHGLPLHGQQQQMFPLPMLQRPLMGGNLNYPQLLAQQLGQLQLLRQQISQQMKTVGQAPNGQQQQQMLVLQLNWINQSINYINRQLVLMSQLSSQQKELKSQDGNNLGSSQVGKNTPPARSKSDSKLAPSRSLSNSGTVSSSSDIAKSITYGMHSLSFSGTLAPSSLSQSSARSVSRLQQIMSNSAGSDDLNRDEFSHITPSGPGTHMSTSTGQVLPEGSCFSTAQLIPSTSSALLSVAPSSTPSAAVVSPQLSIDDIPEFKPGVPWQPRQQPTEPAQLYASSDASRLQSTSGNGGPVMKFNQSSLGGKIDRPSPQLQQQLASSSFPSKVAQPIGPQPLEASKFPHQKLSWNKQTTSAPNSFSSVYPSRSSLPNRPNHSSEVPRVHKGGPSSMPSQLPISSPQPTFDLQKQSSVPAANSYGLESSHSQSQLWPQDSNAKSWGVDPRVWKSKQDSSFSGPGYHSSPQTHPNTCDPYPLLSASSNPESFSSGKTWNQEIKTWSQDRKPWSQDRKPWSQDGKTWSQDRAWSQSEGKPWNQDGRMWGQSGMSSSSDDILFSPDPSFKEWQPGKKANLSSLRPSNPPSTWLIIRNVTTQVCCTGGSQVLPCMQECEYM